MSDARSNWKNALQPTASCIAIDRLGEELTVQEREHLAQCPRCQSEMALFQEFNAPTTRAEAADVQWIAQTIAPRDAGTRSNVVPLAPRKKRVPQRFLAVAATLLVVIGIGYLVQNREPSIDVPVTGTDVYRSSRIDVISPAGELVKAPAELRWVAVPGATTYAVHLFEVDRSALWSVSTREARVELPSDVVARFVPGKTILWEVTARRDAVVVGSSGTQRFRVTPR